MLKTTRAQCRLLNRYFVQREDIEIDPSELTQPWREIFLLADRYTNIIVGGNMLSDACTAVASDEEEAAELLRLIKESSEEPQFTTLSDIADSLPPVEWLWEDWIPRGMLSLLGAYQGTGKSYFVLDLARAVIDGSEWPDGTPAKRGTVIYVDAEGIPTIHNQRAISIGLDRTKLYLEHPGDSIVMDLTERKWQDRLIDMVTFLKPELVIIDSLSSVSSSGQNSTQDTNALLMFFVALARYGNCGMLLLHHLRKPQGGQMILPGMSIHDFRGSGHITAMARSVLGMSVVQSGKQFSLNGARRLDLVKTNVATRYPDSLGIVQQQDGDNVTFSYGEAPAYDSESSVSDDCEKWLLDYLAENGPTKSKDIVIDGEECGYSERTIYRVRKRLGDAIANTHGKQSPHNRWALPGQIDDEFSTEEEL